MDINEKFISVIIVTYNRLELLKQCIEAVESQKRKFNEIIIVNNCSNDGTEEYLELKNNIKTYKTEKNLGGAGGYVFGLEKVSPLANYVLFIDDDAILDNMFLNNIENSIVDEIKAYSGVVKTNKIIDKSHRRVLINDVFMFEKNVHIDKYNDVFFDYDLSSFCGLLVSNEVIKKIGLPNKDFFIWYDDTEYSLRIRKYTKIRNINSAIIDHKVTIGSYEKLTWKSYYGYRNKLYTCKNYSKCPIIYLTYRYSFHIYRMTKHCIKYLLLRNTYDLNCMYLHKDVILSSLKNQLGFNEKYSNKKVI